MKFYIDKSFDKDIDKIRDKNILLKLQEFLSSVEKAKNINEISHLKKLRVMILFTEQGSEIIE